MPRPMSFEDALSTLKHGRKIARAGWNGKWMYLFMIPEASMLVPHKFGSGYHVAASVWIKTVDEEIVPWVCSQKDLLADDWEVVDNPVRQDQITSQT